MSQTACPHCGSTNNLKTAGQLYCADCGQLIDASKPKKTESKSPKVVSHKAPVAKSQTKASTPPLNLRAIDEARATTKKPSPSKPGVLDLKNAQPKAPAKKTIGRHVPPASVAKPEISVTPAVVKIPVQRKFHHKLALRDGLKSITTGKAFVIAFAATLLATLAETSFSRWFAASGSYAISQSFSKQVLNGPRFQTIIDHLGWALLLGYISYLVYHYALADIIFRTSRIFDRRFASAAQCRRAALGSLAGLFAIDLITWMLALTSLTLVAAANIGFIGTKSLGIFGLILAGLTNLVAAYVWLGLIAARHMATYAVVLGQVGVRRAYSAGWALYTRQFGRLTNGLLLIGLVTAIVAVPATLAWRLASVSTTLGFALIVALSALTQAIILIIGAVYFLRLYRFLISQEYDADLGHLLSGRQPRQSHVARRLIVLSAVSIVVIVVSLLCINYAAPIAKALIR